jgi:ABC-type uncharacterized transport system substrate-binding protein
MRIIHKLIITASITLSSLFGLSFSANAANILLIESYHTDYDWDISYKKALTDNLADHTITVFEMDTKRLPANMHQKKADEAWEKYKELKPDYVILGDDSALKYLGEKLAKTHTPTIFLGINNNPRNYFENNALPKNMTGILERPLLNRSVVQIKDILPQTQKILILFDNGITSQSSVTPEMKSGKIGNIIVKSELIETGAAWKKAVQNAKTEGFDAIIVGLYQTLKDENGDSIPADDILSWTNENSELPLFALWNFAVGKGKTAGGIVLDGYKMGEAAAKHTNEVISGTIPSVKINKDGTPIFSKFELERWGITIPESIQEKSVFYD